VVSSVQTALRIWGRTAFQTDPLALVELIEG
jgi:hypothetical protein